MTAGWIKLHRQIRDNPIYQNSTAVHLWLECLLRASHEERKVFLKRDLLDLKQGEFVFGYRELAQVVGCSVSTAKFWMDHFEAERMIELTTTTKGSICKLKNWAEYQSTERFAEHAANAERTPSEPNKKVEKVKNEKNTGDKLRDEITKHLGREECEIDNPTAYLSKLERETSWPAIERAWKEWRRGTGINSPAQFFTRAKHYHNPKSSHSKPLEPSGPNG